MKKYELIKEGSENLYRIKALRDFSDVKAGDLGGWVQSEDNLSHEGDCWIYDEAKAYQSSKVYDNAKLTEEAEIFGFAKAYQNSHIPGDARVYGRVQVHGNIKLKDNAIASGEFNIHDSIFEGK